MIEEAFETAMSLEYSLPSHLQEHTVIGAFDDNVFIGRINRDIFGGRLK